MKRGSNIDIGLFGNWLRMNCNEHEVRAKYLGNLFPAESSDSYQDSRQKQRKIINDIKLIYIHCNMRSEEGSDNK